MTRNFAADTDAGIERDLNEDSVLAEELDGRLLLAVADGMGGYNAGEVASELALDVLESYMKERQGDGDLKDLLRRGFEEANREVHGYVDDQPELRKIGTTLTAAVVTGDEAVLANVGDSRAYVIEGKEIRQVTRDHSLIGDLVREGEISVEEARRNPMRNIVTRDVGTQPEVEVDTYWEDLDDRVLLLCSDGLTEELTDGEILEAVSESGSAEEAVSSLISLAREKGGSDNIAVAVAYPGGQGT